MDGFPRVLQCVFHEEFSLLTFWGWISSKQTIIRLIHILMLHAGILKSVIIIPGFFAVAVASWWLHIHHFRGRKEVFASVRSFQTFFFLICVDKKRKVSLESFFFSKMQNYIYSSVMVVKKLTYVSINGLKLHRWFWH